MRLVFTSVLAAAVVGVFAAPAATQPPKGDDPKPAAVVPKDNVKMDEATKKAVDKCFGSWPTDRRTTAPGATPRSPGSH